MISQVVNGYLDSSVLRVLPKSPHIKRPEDETVDRLAIKVQRYIQSQYRSANP